MPLREASALVTTPNFGGHVLDDVTLGAINLRALAIRSRSQPATYLTRPCGVGANPRNRPTRDPGCAAADAARARHRRDATARDRRAPVGPLCVAGLVRLDGGICLLGLRYPDGISLAHWVPDWSGAELEPQLHHTGGSLAPIAEIDAFARDAARFLLTLGLLAEVEAGPLRIEIDKRERATRHIYRDEQYAPAACEVAPNATEGRVAVAVAVLGHMKCQRYGEGRAKTRWIYVASYEARRWIGLRWAVEPAADAD